MVFKLYFRTSELLISSMNHYQGYGRPGMGLIHKATKNGQKIEMEEGTDDMYG